jgi:tryptophan synthase alpha chain
MLEAYLRRRLAHKPILLMTHIVLGYPSLEVNRRVASAMVEAGVDLMELQIPFSEPIADGPVILAANQRALHGGTTVRQCFDLAAELCAAHPIPFLFMSYTNILFRYGFDRFAAEMARAGLRGAIVPDLPPEEGAEYLAAMAASGLDPIFIFAPTSAPERLARIAAHARGMVYCVARRGVTGAQTDFSDELTTYLDRCRRATPLPLAVGFGVQGPADIAYLEGKAEIAVVGSQVIRLVEAQGPAAVGPFIRQMTRA